MWLSYVPLYFLISSFFMTVSVHRPERLTLAMPEKTCWQKWQQGWMFAELIVSTSGIITRFIYSVLTAFNSCFTKCGSNTKQDSIWEWHAFNLVFSVASWSCLVVYYRCQDRSTHFTPIPLLLNYPADRICVDTFTNCSFSYFFCHLFVWANYEIASMLVFVRAGSRTPPWLTP